MLLAGICKWDDFSSVYYECFSYNGGDDDVAGTGTHDEYHGCCVDNHASCFSGNKAFFIRQYIIFRRIQLTRSGRAR